MNKKLVPLVALLVGACNSGDGTGTKAPPSDISTMQVGEVRALVPGDIPNGIDLPAGSGARDYIVIVGNTNTAHDVVANYVVRADHTTGASFGIESSADLYPEYSRQISGAVIGKGRQQLVHARVRGFERSGLSLRGSANPLDISSRVSARRSAQVATASVPVVGDLINLKIPDAASNNLCTNFFATQARVASVSSKAILAVDTLDGPPQLLFSQAVLDSITAEFDNITFRTDSSYFGNPTDVDGNGRIILLYSGEINKLTPPGSGSIVAGFFFAGDFFPSTDQGGGEGSFCQQSNGAEIFYLLSPDPTGRFGNVRNSSEVRQSTRGTIAHEFQHMINAGRRFQNTAVESFESAWLDEALAHVAEDAVGRVSRGFTDLQTLNFNDVLPCNTPCKEANDFNAFFFQNFARLTDWMVAPESFSPMSKMADTSLATRGAAWAYVRYALDHYSNGLPRDLSRKLVAGPDTGVKNFVAAVGSPVDTVVKGWLVTMYADHLVIPNLDAKYQYRTYNFRSIMPPVARAVLNQPGAGYPLKVDAIGSGNDNITAKNRSGTGTYYRLNVPAGASAKNVKVLDTSGNPANFAGERIYVLRLN